MAKINLTEIGTLTPPASAVAALNDNVAEIARAMDKTLSRDGQGPNQMEAELDMNSQKILNVADPEANHDAVNLESMQAAIAGALFDGATVYVEGGDSVLRTDLAADDGASLIGYKRDATGAQARTPATFFDEGFVSVTEFGVVGDGTTDNVADLRACANYCMDNGKTMYFPDGDYLCDFVAATGVDSITLTGSLRIVGSGNAKIIRREILGTESKSVFRRRDIDNPGVEYGYFEVDNMKFEGMFDTVGAEQISVYLAIGGYDRIRVTNCTFKNISYMPTSFNNCNDVLFMGNHFENCARDAARGTYHRSMRVIGNTFKHIFDDCVVGAHVANATDVHHGEFVVTGNTMIEAQGIHGGGAKVVNVSGNSFLRCHGRHINITTNGVDGTEGSAIVHSIAINSNVIVDPMARVWSTDGITANWQTALSTSYITRCIYVSGALAPDGGTLEGTNGGVLGLPMPYGRMGITDEVVLQAGIIPKTHAVVVSNNVIMRTMINETVLYSTYGYGNPPTKFKSIATDLTVLPTTHKAAGVVFSGHIASALVHGNHFEGIDYGVRYHEDDTSVCIDELIISNNVFHDIRKACVGVEYEANTTCGYVKSLTLSNNVANVDPYYMGKTEAGVNVRRTDGSWQKTPLEAADGLARAFFWSRNMPGHVTFIGNTIKNAATVAYVVPGTSNYPDSYLFNNNILWVGTGSEIGSVLHDSNYGLGQIVPLARNLAVYYDADLASGTFGDVQQTLYSNGAKPTTGYYGRGHVVYDSTPSAAGSFCWVRILSGTDHVIDVDWAEVPTS